MTWLIHQRLLARYKVSFQNNEGKVVKQKSNKYRNNHTKKFDSG